MATNATLARNLKRIRTEKGLSKYALAKTTGLSDQYIGQLEARVKDNPTMDVLSRLAAALGCSILDLLKK